MQLISLKLNAAGVTGWESELLYFGPRITQLYGPNGCGKTPLMAGITFALGYPASFRDDVATNCESVTLELILNSHTVRLTRQLASAFDLTVAADGEQTSYYNERDFAQFFFRELGLDLPILTTVGNEATQPYVATLLPLFFLDQDTAYTNVYKAPKTFIRDQYAEMVRLVFGLEPKNSFDRKKRLFEKQEQLDQLDRAIVKASAYSEKLARERSLPRRPVAEIEADLQGTRERLELLRNSKEFRSDAQLALSPLIHQKQAEVAGLDRDVTVLHARIKGFERMEAEIEGEINTLSLNEEARRIFASFSEICAKPGCGLFILGSETYGKNLLYLRDQVKDLKRNNIVQRDLVATLTGQRDEVRKQLDELLKRRTELESSSDIDGLISSITELTQRLYFCQREKTLEDELDAQERAYVQLLNQRKGLQDDLAVLGGSQMSGDFRGLEIRSSWRALIVFWLDILQTKNVPRDVSMDSDFNVLFGGEKVSQFKGSTLVRVVLAIRTACFQLFASDPQRQPRFFILDTPRQQDIQRESLSNYINALKTLAGEYGFQVVFSTTDYHYEGGEEDREWLPSFDGPEQQMFLRVPAAQSLSGD